MRRGVPTLGVLAAALLIGSVASAHAQDPGPWASIGVLSGATLMDPSLADYQWDTRFHGAYGAEARVGMGRWAGGARIWRTQTTQAVEAPGVTADPIVRATSLELVAHIQLFELHGMRVAGLASGGRRHLGFSPDELSVDTGGGNVTRVRLAPVDEWIAGGGLSLEHTFGAQWDLGLQVDHGVFGLDTAHRVGAGIETGRESFGEWNARFALAKRFQRR